MQGRHSEEKAWRQTYLVDRKQLDSLGKDVSKMFPFSLTLPPWADRLSKVLAEHEQQQVRLGKEERSTMGRLGEIRENVEGLRETLRHYEQTSEFLLRVQKISESTLGKMEQFREKMASSYEELADQEEEMSEELQMMAKRIESMGRDEPMQMKENVKSHNREGKGGAQPRPPRKAEPARNQEESEEQEQETKLGVIERRLKETERETERVERELSGLGRHLGWPEQDHSDFLSIWQRGPYQKNYFQIQEELKKYFGFYTGEQIQEHMNKHIRWKKLTEEKKELIVKYKGLKEQRKVEELRVMRLEEDRSRVKEAREEARRRQEREQVEMKGKVEQWREAKAREKLEEEEQRKREQQESQRNQAARRREAEEKNKQLIGQWREEQEERREVERVRSARKAPGIDKQTQERIRAREERQLMKKLEAVNSRKQEEESARQREERRKEQKFAKFAYVGNKLEHKTTAMREKERGKFEGKEGKEAQTFGGQLLATGVRATPGWMKGV